MVSNFGNFIALGVLYLLSTDLPLLPIQVLLTSVVADVPLITISTDTVDDSEVVRPEKHNMKELILLSLVLGVPTALFELLYFALIASQPERLAQTSLYVFITFLSFVVFYAIRNRDHFWKTKTPSHLLNFSFLLASAFSLAIIYIPQSQTWFSFVPIAFMSVITIFILMITYLFALDLVKVLYYRRSTS